MGNRMGSPVIVGFQMNTCRTRFITACGTRFGCCLFDGGGHESQAVRRRCNLFAGSVITDAGIQEQIDGARLQQPSDGDIRAYGWRLAAVATRQTGAGTWS